MLKLWRKLSVQLKIETGKTGYFAGVCQWWIQSGFVGFLETHQIFLENAHAQYILAFVFIIISPAGSASKPNEHGGFMYAVSHHVQT